MLAQYSVVKLLTPSAKFTELDDWEEVVMESTHGESVECRFAPHFSKETAYHVSDSSKPDTVFAKYLNILQSASRVYRPQILPSLEPLPRGECSGCSVNSLELFSTTARKFDFLAQTVMHELTCRSSLQSCRNRSCRTSAGDHQRATLQDESSSGLEQVHSRRKTRGQRTRFVGL